MNFKKTFFAATTLAVVLLYPFAADAHPIGDGTVERIESFDATIRINANASIRVEELIYYDFGVVERHGIYRTIPYKYQARGGNYELRISDITVTDDKGRPQPFRVADDGSRKTIKIGDPDRFVASLQAYRISYTVRRAINYFPDHDELYWNVTGNGWSVAIEQASAAVVLPKDVIGSALRFDCFVGPAGSAERCGEVTRPTPNFSSNQVAFSHKELQAGEGLTVVVGFPKGMVAAPSKLQEFSDIIKDNWILGLPVATFAVLFYIWRRRGRDPRGRGVIVAQYESPDGLTPAEVGTIVDEQAEGKDISAEIVQLAVNGYLKIIRRETKGIFKNSVDYELEELRQPDAALADFQTILLDKLFAEAVKLPVAGTTRLRKFVTLSRLKNKFYKDLPLIKDAVYESLVNRGYCAESPEKIRNQYLTWGGTIVFIGIALGGLFSRFSGLLSIGSIVVSGILVMIFGFFMPQKNPKGVAAKEAILGLKEYLSVAEKDRIKFHNAPEKSPKRFEKLLPYAMVLGVEQEWARQFEAIYTQPPQWYEGGEMGAFNAVIFANSLGQFTATSQSVLASTPSSAAGGGSGFSGGSSGGGFGGGGGGSW